LIRIYYKSDPQRIFIDEPSLGLAPVIAQEVFEVLERLKQEVRIG
jgi:ABC-type branched-subunit amino acid transport system ATPase component